MAQSSRVIKVSRHDPACAILTGGECGCQPEVTTQRYERVCATCGGKLINRRRPYCSGRCRHEARVRSKSANERQMRDDEYRARASEP